jgi:16S rRNA (guanine966-N2)-methyltransferase
VIAGAARGRRLGVPPGQGTRPTSDRAREALFSTLESLVTAWAGRRVLDLYAGSGAVGLEALSRGAAHALLVEADARAVRTVNDNVATLGLAGAVVRQGRVERVVADGLPGTAYDVVFADPPYDLDDASLAAVLTDLRPALADGAVVAVERATRGGGWVWPAGFEGLRSRRYGEATLWYGRATPGPPPPASGVEESPA